MEYINIDDYNYDLPEDRIAKYPVNEREMSKLLVYNEDRISEDVFTNIDRHIPSGSLLVFNNTRVIRARLLFKKESGAAIEVLCLEPLTPYDYSRSLGSVEEVEWKCIIGNLKKWKTGKLHLTFQKNEKRHILTAEKICSEGEAWRIRFNWDSRDISFGEVIEAAGHIPLPPYLNRTDTADDNIRYQTVYSSVNGSVAAPTAGLHFTDSVLRKLRADGIYSAEITLHVGAGTFQPVKTHNIVDHEMHCEHFFVTTDTIELLLKNTGKILSVGTTSVRTLESLYWLGVMIANKQFKIEDRLVLEQWDAYRILPSLTTEDSLITLLEEMKKSKIQVLQAATSIFIVPGYRFRMINGIITNFHQPKSTLLLLISAWIGEKWRNVYSYALENDFRFLSYGDSSILLR